VTVNAVSGVALYQALQVYGMHEFVPVMHVSFVQMCDCHILRILRCVFPHKLALLLALIFFELCY